MPRISDQRKAERREQILEAARACVQDYGLEAVSMEMIITRSGLSTGAVYGYFKGKESIIGAAVSEGTARLGEALLPILTNPAPPSPPRLIEQVLETIVGFGPDESGIDRLLVAIHGWSHAQSDSELRASTNIAYGRLRQAYAQAARRMQQVGTLTEAANPDAVAQLLTSITLGFVAQRALSGSADIRAHVDALEALIG